MAGASTVPVAPRVEMGGGVGWVHGVTWGQPVGKRPAMEEGNWVEPTLQPMASQVEAPQHRHPLSPLSTLNDGLLSLLQTLCQRTQVISISMHVPGPGTNLDCKIYSRHKTCGGVGVELIFFQCLDPPLRLLFIPSSRWSTGKGSLLITNPLYPKEKQGLPAESRVRQKTRKMWLWIGGSVLGKHALISALVLHFQRLWLWHFCQVWVAMQLISPKTNEAA